ncbi:MAG: MFS transporter [Erythrobacter sp.]
MTGSKPQQADAPRHQPWWFLLLFAFAAGGGWIAYVPLLTVLLPLQVTEMTGDGDVAALAQITFIGAIAASLSAILWGWLSDRSGVRLPWILGGLILSSGLLLAIGETRSLNELLICVILWQIALNMMLAALFAYAGDCFPDSQKGMLGGAFALAPALGALSGSLVTSEVLVAVEQRVIVVVALVAALVLPVVLLGRGRVRPELMEGGASAKADAVPHDAAVVVRMWIARFLVQVAVAGLFAFLLYWLRSISPAIHENYAANIYSIVLVISVPLAFWAGRWSDRQSRPMAPLWLSASASGVGLVLMAGSNGLAQGIAGYIVFSIASAIFLALHTGQTLRVLPQPRHRGRDLGVFNLTNTLPAMVMPGLTLSLVPSFGFTALFALFAAFAVVAALLLATIPARR